MQSFFFFSHLLPSQENAEIVWGWVVNRQNGVVKAHVWYQLKDREEKEYIVEGFSGDWDGIMPMEIVNKKEARKPILRITHIEVRWLLNIISRPDSWYIYKILANSYRSTNFVKNENHSKNKSQSPFTRCQLDAKRIGNMKTLREYMSSWNQSVDYRRVNTISGNKILKIFIKLHELFTRYAKQGVDNNANHIRRNLNHK